MRLELEVRRDDEGRLSGSVGAPSHEKFAFVGVLGFVAAVERCLAGTVDSAPAPAPATAAPASSPASGGDGRGSR